MASKAEGEGKGGLVGEGRLEAEGGLERAWCRASDASHAFDP